MMQFDDMRTRLRVSGRVQGVGFRWFVVTEAERLGLRGWVRNTTDGAVELEAAGPESAIAELRRRLENGPPAARVHHVTVMAAGVQELPAGFEIRP